MKDSTRIPRAYALAIVLGGSLLPACQEAAPPARDPSRTEPGVWADVMWVAQNDAARCARPGLPEGRGRVDLDVDVDGHISDAALAVGPYKNTPVETCVLSVAKNMKLPAPHQRMKTQLRVVVGRDDGSWLHPGEFDRFSIEEQARVVDHRIWRDCITWRTPEPDVHAHLVFAPTTGRVANVTLDTDRLGGVGRCIEDRLRDITVPPFEGDGTIVLTLGRPLLMRTASRGI